MNNHKASFGRIASLALALSLLAAPLALSAVEGTLTIVTSYPKDTTGTFKKAFEKKYPNFYFVDVNNKGRHEIAVSDFDDLDHLNDRGAKTLTLILNDLIKGFDSSEKNAGGQTSP